MEIKFHEETHPQICLPPQANLSEHLNIQNSPVLFGCRTGVCGTCLCEVTVFEGQLSAPSDDEKELLEIIASDNPKARLACQMKGEAKVELKYLGC